MTDQRTELARQFPDGFVERTQGNDYVAHHIVNQRLLQVTGPFDFELVQIIRGDVAAKDPDPNGSSRRAKAGTPALTGIVVGAIWRLRCEIDGRDTVIEEIGDVGDVHNWTHDGARLKDAASDALKRCAMRFGLGLHLWAQEHYFLHEQLLKDQAAGTTPDEPQKSGQQGPPSVRGRQTADNPADPAPVRAGRAGADAQAPTQSEPAAPDRTRPGSSTSGAGVNGDQPLTDGRAGRLRGWFELNDKVAPVTAVKILKRANARFVARTLEEQVQEMYGWNPEQQQWAADILDNKLATEFQEQAS